MTRWERRCRGVYWGFAPDRRPKGVMGAGRLGLTRDDGARPLAGTAPAVDDTAPPRRIIGRGTRCPSSAWLMGS